MSWQFTLDATDYGDPLDWNTTTISIKREKSLKALHSSFDVPTTFNDAAYDYIIGVYDADYTDTIAVNINYRCSVTDPYVTQFAGTLAVADCEINRHLKLVQCVIRGTEFGAVIKNNKTLKAYPNTVLSKNGITIIQAAKIQVDFFIPSTGVYSATNRECYLAYDVLEWLVVFMSDGALSFGSEFLKAAGQWETLYNSAIYLTTGHALYDNSTDYPPFVSFAELFAELDKRIGLGMYIDEANSTLYIEAESATIGGGDEIYQTGASIVTLRNVKHLGEYIDSDKLYANVSIGTSETQRTESGTFQWPDIRFFNFKEEEYFMTGQYNSGNTLDLLADYITDSNVIEDIIVNSIDDHDDTTILVEVETGAVQAQRYDLFVPGGVPYSYNRYFTNQEIMPRHIGGVTSDANLYLADVTQEFQAEKTRITNSGAGGVVALAPIDYDDNCNAPNFDTGGNYDGGDGTGGMAACGGAAGFQYTVPVTGHYLFSASVVTTNVVPAVADGTPNYQLTFNWQLNTVTDQTDAFLTLTGAITLTVTYYGFFTGGDTIEVDLSGLANEAGPAFTSYDVSSGFFKSDTTTAGGGIFQEYDKDDNRVISYKFNKPMTFSEFQTLQADMTGRITINCGDDATDDIDTWIDEVKYNINTGTADFILRTSRNDS